MNGLAERLEHFAGAFWAALGTAAGGAVVWIIRTIFTNKKVAEAAQQSVEELRKEIKRRDEQREEDRRVMHRIEDRLDRDVKTLQDDVKAILQRGD